MHVVFAGLVLIALVFRIRVEEPAVGDRSREFAADRARLVPYVW